MHAHARRPSRQLCLLYVVSCLLLFMYAFFVYYSFNTFSLKSKGASSITGFIYVGVVLWLDLQARAYMCVCAYMRLFSYFV